MIGTIDERARASRQPRTKAIMKAEKNMEIYLRHICTLLCMQKRGNITYKHHSDEQQFSEIVDYRKTKAIYDIGIFSLIPSCKRFVSFWIRVATYNIKVNKMMPINLEIFG
jgi:hypothetical protein